MAGLNTPFAKPLDRYGGVWLLPLAIAVVAFAAVGSTTTWITLTVAGLAMGMMIFVMASGLSLIFGLMDVLNFGHAAFVSFGAFIAASVLSALSHWVQAGSVILNLAAIFAALAAACLFGAIVGWAYERVIVKPVYGDHLRQILITVGALIVSEELIYAIWGGAPIYVARPAFLDGSIIVGNVVIETYRVFAFLLGLVVFGALQLVLNRTRIGLLVRAGVDNREMVETLGFRIDRLFVAVFVVGSALAALGGGVWAGFHTLIDARVGSEMLVLVFIVIIIGGFGSVEGSLLGAVMVGLTANYVAFLFPKLSLASNMLLMMAILLWKPYGLKPAVKS